MNIADKYFLETLKEIQTEGTWDQSPRPRWVDKTPAFTKFITQKTFNYRIDKGELPIISLRPTAIKGSFYDIQAIYQKQTSVVEKMHPSIYSWWKDFIVGKNSLGQDTIGKTYGDTVRRYYLVDQLLNGMEKDPFGRRHIMNLWQHEQFEDDTKALKPCAYETVYSITETEDAFLGKIRFIDMTLNQRSQDYIMTCSINPIQYTMLGMMISNHLTFKTGIKHVLRKFQHNIQNVHIYDRHMFAIEELFQRTPAEIPCSLLLKEHKNFYDYQYEDFEISIPWHIQPLSKKLEIAI